MTPVPGKDKGREWPIIRATVERRSNGKGWCWEIAVEDFDGNSLLHFNSYRGFYLEHDDLPWEKVKGKGKTESRFGARVEARREVKRIRRMVRIYRGENGREVFDA